MQPNKIFQEENKEFKVKEVMPSTFKNEINN